MLSFGVFVGHWCHDRGSGGIRVPSPGGSGFRRGDPLFRVALCPASPSRLPGHDVGLLDRRCERRDGADEADARQDRPVHRRVHGRVRCPRSVGHHAVPGDPAQPARTDRGRRSGDRGDGRPHRGDGGLQPGTSRLPAAGAPLRRPSLPPGEMGGAGDGDGVRLRVDPLHRTDTHGGARHCRHPGHRREGDRVARRLRLGPRRAFPPRRSRPREAVRAPPAVAQADQHRLRGGAATPRRRASCRCSPSQRRTVHGRRLWRSKT